MEIFVTFVKVFVVIACIIIAISVIVCMVEYTIENNKKK